MSSSVHTDNKNKDILIIGGGPAQGLDDTTLTVEVKYPINFVQPRKRLIYQFKVKGSEIKHLKKKAGLKRSVKFFASGFNPIDTNILMKFLYVHKYLMKNT